MKIVNLCIKLITLYFYILLNNINFDKIIFRSKNAELQSRDYLLKFSDLCTCRVYKIKLLDSTLYDQLINCRISQSIETALFYQSFDTTVFPYKA